MTHVACVVSSQVLHTLDSAFSGPSVAGKQRPSFTHDKRFHHVFCITCGKPNSKCGGHLIEFTLPDEKLCCIYPDQYRARYLAALLQIFDPDTGMPFRPCAVEAKVDALLLAPISPSDAINVLSSVSVHNTKKEPAARIRYKALGQEESNRRGPIQATTQGGALRSVSGWEAKKIIAKASASGHLAAGSKLATLLGYTEKEKEVDVAESITASLIASTVFILPQMCRPDRCLNGLSGSIACVPLDEGNEDGDADDVPAFHVNSDSDSEEDEDDGAQKIKDPTTLASEQFYAAVFGETNRFSASASASGQRHRSTFFKPDPKKVQKAFGSLCRSIEKRIDGKAGRVRSNILGTTVNMCARSVISGDPYIKIGEVGVPIGFATRLPVKDVVNRFNIDRIKDSIKRGLVLCVSEPSSSSDKPPVYYLDNSIIPQTTSGGSALRHPARDVFGLVAIGWTVTRALWDGDRVIMNRQPTLHNASLMSHRVKIVNSSDLTFRLNPNCTDSYNADFDGDEMNLHVVDPLASADLENMSVESNMITTQNSSPVISIKQDSLIGLFLMTTAYINQAIGGTVVARILSALGSDCIETYLSHQKTGVVSSDRMTPLKVISLALPQTLTMRVDEENGTCKLWIIGGSMLFGILTKANVKTILHEVWTSMGRHVALTVMDRLHIIAHEWIGALGFGISHADMVGALGPLEALDPLKVMIDSGSKGKTSNAVQMLQSLGDQFFKSDLIGNVRHGFCKGLTPWEMFLHARTARPTAIATATLTPMVGATYRKCVKIMQDLRPVFDGTVRDASSGRIVTFKYGDDGYDARYIKIEPLSRQPLAAKLAFRGRTWSSGNQPTVDVLSASLPHDADAYMVSAGEPVGMLCAQSINQQLTQLTMNMFQSSGTKEKGWQQIQRIDNLLNARTGRDVRITAPHEPSMHSYDKFLQVLFSDCRIGNFQILPDAHASNLSSTIKRIKGRLNQAADDRIVFVEMSTPGRRDSPRIVCLVNAVIDTYFKGVMRCDRLVRPGGSGDTTVLLFAFSKDIKAMKDRSDDGVLDFIRHKLDPTLLKGLPFVSRIGRESGFTVLETGGGISPCEIIEISLDICDKDKQVKVANDCQAAEADINDDGDGDGDGDGAMGMGMGMGGGVGYLRSFEYILLAFRKSSPSLWRHLRIDDPRIAEATLGVEAARQVLVEQLSTLLGGVGLRHLTLLADIMTAGGFLAPMDHQKGIRCTDGDYVLGHACFGRSSVALVKGLLNRHKDVLLSTDARVMMGLPPPLGHSKTLFEVRSVLAIKPKPILTTSSPMYSPSSPAYANAYANVPYYPSSVGSPMYLPSSPAYAKIPYSPTNPGGGSGGYSPSSPAYVCIPYSPSRPAAGTFDDAGNKRKRKAELKIDDDF